VQVDPIKPMVKAPGATRLKLKLHQFRFDFAFNVNLRPYTKAAAWDFEPFAAKTLSTLAVLASVQPAGAAAEAADSLKSLAAAEGNAAVRAR